MHELTLQETNWDQRGYLKISLTALSETVHILGQLKTVQSDILKKEQKKQQLSNKVP